MAFNLPMIKMFMRVFSIIKPSWQRRMFEKDSYGD